MLAEEPPITTKREVKVLCPKCRADHLIPVETSMITNAKRFPVKYAYIHGNPRVILTLYIDHDFNVRAIEVNEFFDMQREELDDILTSNKSNTLKDLSTDQILGFVFTNDGSVVRRYVGSSAKIPIFQKAFRGVWKQCNEMANGNGDLAEFFLKFPDYWVAGVRFDTCELNIVVAPDVDIDRLNTQVMMLFEKIANSI